MRTPLVVVTGVHALAMDATLMSLAWDVPRAVSVRHRIDPSSQVLARTVADASGVLEREQVQLEHACVSCALREDVVPTLERLGSDGRWEAVLSGLPQGSEADQLVHVAAADPRLARHLRLSSVVAALGDDIVGDLLGDALLQDRGAHSNPDDDRGLAEVACAQVELADVVVLGSEPDAPGLDLVRALARPEVSLVTGATSLDAGALVGARHHGDPTDTWRSLELDTALPALSGEHAWRLDLSSPRPFHPGRLLDHVESLGTGEHRSRGRFWVPSRPGDMLEWSGAAGHLSMGAYSPWGRRAPLTRLVLTGLGTPPDHLAAAFEELLLSPTEALLDGHRWDTPEDGLEPWLGEIRDAA